MGSNGDHYDKDRNTRPNSGVRDQRFSRITQDICGEGKPEYSDTGVRNQSYACANLAGYDAIGSAFASSSYERPGVRNQRFAVKGSWNEDAANYDATRNIGVRNGYFACSGMSGRLSISNAKPDEQVGVRRKERYLCKL